LSEIQATDQSQDRIAGAVQNDVLIGLNQHLFLAGGAHKTLEFAVGKIEPPASSYRAFEKNIRSRIDITAARGIPYLHVISPEKHSVLVEAIPFPISVRLGERYVANAPSAANSILYPFELFRQHRDHCFLRTDTHPSDYGIIILTAEIIKRLVGLDCSEEASRMLSSLSVEQTIEGDLGSKVQPPIKVTEKYLSSYWKAFFFSNKLPTNNGVCDIWISPGAVTDKRLLIFGDSVGRAIARVGSRFFREIVFLRTPFFHDDLIDQLRPDLMISENVERYLSLVQSDEDRPSFHMYPYLSGGAHVPGKEFAQAFSALLSFPRRPYKDFMRKYLQSCFA
jgi:hypothetical protein